MTASRLWVAAGFLLAAAPASSAPSAFAQGYQHNLDTPVTAQVCRAAEALAHAQRDFAGAPASWEWQRGTGQVARNASGTVAMALARAGCGDPEVLRRFVRARAAEADGRFLFDADIEVLAHAAAAGHDAHLAQVAKSAFERRYGGATGQEIVERFFWGRPSTTALVGFDASLALRAAVAVGETAKGREIADALVATLPRWAEGADENGWRTSSRGAALEALARLDAARYGKPASDLVHHLVLSQATDGSWAEHNTQATAFAVRGLASRAEPTERAAADHGKRWLRLTQLGDGSWATFNDFLPEPFVGDHVHAVTAEALLALVE